MLNINKNQPLMTCHLKTKTLPKNKYFLNTSKIQEKRKIRRDKTLQITGEVNGSKKLNALKKVSPTTAQARRSLIIQSRTGLLYMNGRPYKTFKRCFKTTVKM